MTAAQTHPSDDPSAERCTAHSVHTGKPCKMYRVPGATVCKMHGGAAPQVKRKARQRLEMATDRLARQLLGMTSDPNVADPVKLAAIRDALDRGGIQAKTAVSVEVGVPKAFEKVFDAITAGPRSDPASAQPLELPAATDALDEPELVDALDVEVIDPQAGDPSLGLEYSDAQDDADADEFDEAVSGTTYRTRGPFVAVRATQPRHQRSRRAAGNARPDRQRADEPAAGERGGCPDARRGQPTAGGTAARGTASLNTTVAATSPAHRDTRRRLTRRWSRDLLPQNRFELGKLRASHADSTHSLG
jgi:hypothetical protein